MSEKGLVYRLGEHRLEPATRVLIGPDGEPIHLAQKPFQVLLFLIEQRPRLVTRAELLERFWNGKDVYDQALTRCVSSIRKALDDTTDPARCIETRWAEGYRFIGAIERSEEPIVAPGSLPPLPTEAVPPDGEDALPVRAAPVQAARPWRGHTWAVLAGCALVIGAAIWLALRGPGPAPGIHRIAVLPVRTPEAEAWLAQALTDRLIATLSKIEGVTVLAPKVDELNELRRHTDVDAVLESTATFDAASVRLEAQLSSPADRSVLWTFEVDHPRLDLMLAEREVAVALASRLTAKLRELPREPRSGEAYARYLRGRYLWSLRTPASLTEAVAEYDAALALDPGYAEAHAGLAETLLMLPQYAGLPPLELRARSRSAAEAALRLDPDAARAHLVLGVIAQYGWDWSAADAHFADAIRANPSHGTAQQWRAESLCFRRRFEQCMQGLAEAQALDPLSPVIAMVQGIAWRWTGDHARALAQFDQVSKRWPAFTWVEIERGKALVAAGRAVEAIPRFEAALETYGVGVVGGPLVFGYARAGRHAEAEAVYAELVAHGSRSFVSPVTLAIAELGLGRNDAALDLLERAVEERDGLAIYLNVDEHFTQLRDEPRFAALLVRARFVP